MLQLAQGFSCPFASQLGVQVLHIGLHPDRIQQIQPMQIAPHAVFLVQPELNQHLPHMLSSPVFAILHILVYILVEQFEVQSLRTHNQGRLILLKGLVEKHLVPGIQRCNLLHLIFK